MIYFINHRDKLLYVIVTGTEAAGLILKKTSQRNLFLNKINQRKKYCETVRPGIYA